MDFPILLTILLAPIAAALILVFVPKEENLTIRSVAAAGTFVSLALSLYAYFTYDQSVGGLQFAMQIPWIQDLGVTFFLAADGISLPMLLLTNLIGFSAVFASWNINSRPREFFILLLLLIAGVMGTFIAHDLFIFLLFYEVVVIPIYIMVVIWGSSKRVTKEYAGMKLTIGAMRTVAQMVSYELPLVLSLLGVIMIVGSLNMSDIIAAQEHTWLIFTQPIAFLIFFIAAVAETNRCPFDLVEGESEIINGPYTEYGGMGFAMFFLAEYANIMVVCAMATIMFLGGWHAPFGLTFIPSWVWFFIKMYVLIFIVMQFRWTYPRIRIDQLMGFGWKVLVPLSLANIFVTGIGMYIYRAIGW